MALKEINTKTKHYFEDENGQKQGEYKSWWSNGQTWVRCFYVDGKQHGEFKSWYSNGQLYSHCFYQNGKMVVDFIKNPALYPSTDEAKTYFALKYGWTKWL
jgi:antitoxin component YwqK of YwqJK toxin-antitoxin module